MLHVEGHGFPQARDLLEQSLHSGGEQLFEQAVIERALLLGEPASAGHGALYIKAVGQFDIEHRSEAELEHEQGVLDQEATQVSAIGIAFGELDEQGFDVGAWRVRTLARTQRVERRLRDDAPIEQCEQGAITLHGGIMLDQHVHGALVKQLGFWYDGHGKLLAVQVDRQFVLLCLLDGLLSSPSQLHYRLLVRNLFRPSIEGLKLLTFFLAL